MSRRTGLRAPTKSAVLLCLLAGACAAPHGAYSRTLEPVLADGSKAALERHVATLRRMIDNANGAPPPGVHAEFAYCSWKLGTTTAIPGALASAHRQFPGARRFLEALAADLDQPPPR